MGRRRRGRHPYDYTAGDDVRFAESGVGGTLRVLHGPGRGMGVPEGVVCRVEVVAADGTFVDECREGKFGKEHRLHGTVPGDRVTVTVHGGFGEEQRTAARTVRLTGELADVVRFGVGPAWELVAAIDTGDAAPADSAPDAGAWGAGVRLRGACAEAEPAPIAYGAGVRGPVSDDDIEELEFSGRTAADHRRAAATLLAWADEAHPDDEAEPARLLNAAAWHLEQVDEHDAALALHRRAVAARGTVLPDARCYLHAALLRAGLADEARQLSDELRRAAPSDLDVYVFMGENHELAGDLRQAHRWLNLGVRKLELPDLVDVRPNSAYAGYALLRSRLRVREALGLPPDDVDELVPPLELRDAE